MRQKSIIYHSLLSIAIREYYSYIKLYTSYIIHHTSYVLYFTFYFILYPLSFLNAQEQPINNLIIDAEYAFNNNNYKLALNLYQKLDSLDTDNGYFNFMLGISYLYSKTDYSRAISHLEFAAKTITDIKMKPRIIYHLAWAYHLNNRFDEAIEQYQKAIADEMLDATLKIDAKRKIEMCQNAKQLIANPVNVTIKNIGNTINSKYADYAPVISADERILMFTSKRKGSTGGLLNNDGDYFEDIYISYRNEYQQWTAPVNMGKPINTKFHDASIALSVDGEQLLIYRSDKHKKAGEIYTTHKEGSTWIAPVKLGKNINTSFLETAASISADGATIYFSSNREGGFGGKDIYKAEKQPDGEWGTAVNLGATVNTPYDEESPFIHPNGMTLFFSSLGHNSMGGFDIFKTELKNNMWTQPENIGYPINTTSDDVHFVLSAKGKRGYFTSARTGGFGEEDIYVINFPEANIPLTMIRGTVIVKGDKPTEVHVKVIDKESNDLLKYVYDPNPETGKYLIILPPGKNYDMIVEADGYVPYVFNIHIPNQSYFYELYQTMYMKTVSVLDEPIGQGISIETTFKEMKDTLSEKKSEKEKKEQRDSTLLALIEQIIEKTDSVMLYNLEDTLIEKTIEQTSTENSEKSYQPIIDLVENIIEYTDSKALENLETITEQGFFTKADKNVIFYGQGDLELEPIKIGKDTIYVISPTVRDEKIKNDKIYEQEDTMEQQVKGKYEEITIKTLLTHLINFDFEISTLRPKYIEALDNIVATLKEYPQLRVKISGHTDNKGAEEYNLQLSRQRAETVSKYFISKGIDKSRMTILAFGETKPIVTNDTEEGRQKNRRVDIQLIETTIR